MFMTTIYVYAIAVLALLFTLLYVELAADAYETRYYTRVTVACFAVVITALLFL